MPEKNVIDIMSMIAHDASNAIIEKIQKSQWK